MIKLKTGRSGFALFTSLLILTVLTLIFVGGLSRSQKSNEVDQQGRFRKDALIQAESRLKALHESVRDFVQSMRGREEFNYVGLSSSEIWQSALRGDLSSISDGLNSVSPGPRNYRFMKQPGEMFQVVALREGTHERSVRNNDTWPKVFRISFEKSIGDSLVSYRTLVAFGPRPINRISTLIKNITGPYVFAGTTEIFGEIVLNFADPANSRIVFANTQPLRIGSLVTNLADDSRVQYGLSSNLLIDQVVQPVEFTKGVHFNAADFSSDIDQSFQALGTAATTTRVNPYRTPENTYLAGSLVSVSARIESDTNGRCDLVVQSVVRENVQAVDCPAREEERSGKSEFDSDEERTAEEFEEARQREYERELAACREVTTQDVTNIQRIPFSQVESKAIRIDSTVPVRFGDGATTNYCAQKSATIMANNGFSLMSSIQRNANVEGNLALVALRGNVEISAQAMSLSGNPLSNYATSGGGGTTTTFKVDASIVAMNGSFKLAPTYLTAPNPIGGFEFRGSAFNGNYSPLSMVSPTTRNIVSGFSAQNKAWNPDYADLNKVPPGFNSAAHGLIESRVLNVETTVSDHLSAQSFFRAPPVVLDASRPRFETKTDSESRTRYSTERTK